ncbi:C2 calcium-dependent membrane targeting [Corchorus capsularis]|uniref:C2 calcium-dependent membrane targeting n=1 Tax=Corchorus capsularis TaxID=210143 RepID=A0A1R3GQ66_COCAP|nr:C2 calcium-dependent membrane targeting [Corchorus capsularis]
MSTAFSNSPSGEFRILEIKLESSNLNVKKGGQVYVKLSMQDRELQTTSVKNLSRGPNSNPVWNQKFIFSVPHHNFSGKGNSILSFQIFRARKFFKDQLIGSTCCDIKSLFQVHPHHQQDDSVRYDESEEESSDREEEDLRFENMFGRPKIDAEIFLGPKINDHDEEIIAEDDEKTKTTKKNSAGALSASMSLVVGKGLKRKGVLKIEVAVWEGFIACVGDHKWRNAAMPYDDFMCLTNPNFSQKMIKKNREVNVYMCCTGQLM